MVQTDAAQPPQIQDLAQGPASIEPILDPALPIIDAHHHLWFLSAKALAMLESRESISARSLAATFRRHARYLLDEFMADVTGGHNVRASVFVEAHAFYRTSGPVEMQSVGEVEFVNGVAAMAASGAFGDVRVCAGIVGGVDLRLGAAVEEVLMAHIQAGGGRYRGVRSPIIHDESPSLLGANVGAPHILLDSEFRRGFAKLQQCGLSFDALLLEPQLPDLIALAHAFPETQIVLNHVGMPVGLGPYEGRRDARFPIWRNHISMLSKCPNVAVKLGGLGIPFGGFESHGATPQFNSLQLAQEWKPYIMSCIEAFGANRCMFESNFPLDSGACSYRTLWNAFKRIAAGASHDEKAALFDGTARRIYRLDV
jgi:predicted TIM-barrel fold metal-dependent hydrolase